jgi:ABC-type nitrate/sulfonate/bicarbonate transport system substrate-binding protein
MSPSKRILIALTIALCSTWGSSAFAQLSRLEVILDWLPSPEYYGFYYQAFTGGYAQAGLQPIFRNSSGGPVVAAQLGSGSIKIGTTSSDNVLLQAARGARFIRVVPLELFNAVSIVSLPKKPIRQVADLKAAVLGTNPQSSTYAQYEYLLRASGILPGTVKEYPVGFGGAAQLLHGEVDAFLAYTTNQAIDVALQKPDMVELFFSDNGLKNYGLVLAVTNLSTDPSVEVVDRFIRATIEGYRKGASDINKAAEALVSAEPTLNRSKIVAAIEKMAKLNAAALSDVPSNLDEWVTLPSGVNPNIRTELSELYQQGLAFWSQR